MTPQLTNDSSGSDLARRAGVVAQSHPTIEWLMVAALAFAAVSAALENYAGAVTAVRDNDTVNWAVRGNGNFVNNPVNGVTQKFEAGDERNVEFAGGKFIAERRWMIEVNVACPSSNEWTGVEIFDAADPCRFQSE